MTQQAQDIAKGLTEAQRKALVAMPLGIQFNPRLYARQIATVAVLQSKRLIRPIGDPTFDGPWSDNVVTRPLGLEVRRILLGEDQ